MDNMENFALGGWLFILAFGSSFVGCVLGLACTLQARFASTERKRLAWLGLAALSMGGVGIWLMHFIAMLGFDTPGMEVRYDVLRTVLSAVLAVVAVFVGLLVFGVRTNFAWWRLLLGGLITGLAINLMHYTGMWALNVQGSIGYNPLVVLASIVIAVIAATAALWFTVSLNRLGLRLAAGVIMAIAVTGMHYTGMAAIELHLNLAAPQPTGVEVFSFLFPVFVLAAVALAVPICAVLIAGSPNIDVPATSASPLSRIRRNASPATGSAAPAMASAGASAESITGSLPSDGRWT
jgi:NO-binding membrane sensor protein with MHYT domain